MTEPAWRTRAGFADVCNTSFSNPKASRVVLLISVARLSVSFEAFKGGNPMRKSMISSALRMGLVLTLTAVPATAAEMIEAIGGEWCGPLSKPYTVEFLAPDDANLEASARVMVGGGENVKAAPPALTLDGNPCPNGRCTFHATKGHSYTLAATSPGRSSDQLCISITRP